MSEAVAVSDEAPWGRTRITPRALTSTIAAVTADTFRVDIRRVSIDLRDDHGLLAIAIATPIRVLPLNPAGSRDQVSSPNETAPPNRTGPGAVEHSGGTLITRTAQARQTIRERVTELTGARVGDIVIRLAGTEIRARRRVA